MEQLITSSRHRESTESDNLNATQSDRARLIYSASFRRLQQKAQVFSLESNSAVRSRLTHSIEVSHIGRYIVAEVNKAIQVSDLPAKEKVFWQNNDTALSNIVETACLMHDIGNPPFGHFGEAAIIQWAESEDAKQCLEQSIGGINDKTLEALDDFKAFDGNPQGFRIITKLQGDDGQFGLNLTYTQLAAFLKYTHSPSTRKTAKTDAPFSKKIGFFNTESEVINAAWDELRMSAHSRHPLGFLMEASDDISYCMSDIEDGIEKGIIREGDFAQDMVTGLTKLRKSCNDDNLLKSLKKLELTLTTGTADAIGPFLRFKTSLSTFLVKQVAKKFVDNYDNFVNSKATQEIIAEGTIEYNLLDMLKVYTGKYLFTSNEAECMELSGFSIISGILKDYQTLLCLQKDKFLHLINNEHKDIKRNNLNIHRRLFNRLPEKHLNAYKCAIMGRSIPTLKEECLKQHSKDTESLKETKLDDSEIQNAQVACLKQEFQAYFDLQFSGCFSKIPLDVEWNLRTHLVIDFVSGMTDQFSMEFFHMLKGINVR
ncbi:MULTISPECIES: dGTPase [Vibrio harveyi group]|uniref:Deoxyguanosinetriphosphate triphosphohydrolase n=1 Tax=Vibrio owensii CAIM 1854 = LMG 25443 TaxID=1229493 RepID=A0A0C1Z5R2_9VIBR|nr:MULTISPECIES: dGTPase [Vibrio harveyi group]KIF51479.1 deoxyguanosinetriphosphate triphosphohydrolase [Vibrio owensii CAIM 1854 = LMG 25443]